MSMTVKRGLATARYTKDGLAFSVDYIVTGAAHEYEALTAAGVPIYGEAYDQALGSGLVAPCVQSKTAEPAQGTDGGDCYKVSVDFAYPTRDGRPLTPVNGDEYCEFDAQGERVKAQNCISQTKWPANGTTAAPDVGLAVGVGEDGAIEGADVNERAAVLRVHLFKTASQVNAAYVAGLYAEMTKYNSGTYYGFTAGEVYFDSFSIKASGETLCEIVFNFLIRSNLGQSDVPDFKDTAGASITVTGGKKGWQYLWAYPKKAMDGTTDPKKVVRYAGVYVSDFYKTSAFSALGLGGTLKWSA